jgi:tetratricopeptide (TPR) repeat protein
MESKGESGDAVVNSDRAAEDFERGFSLLMDNKWEAAVPFFARATHFEPRNARYHAFFGKALSGDETQRHKAEGELQTAIKLEPDNPSYRMMLAEFFVRNKLMKRAEGELNRLLTAFPDNKEALALLDSLQAK